MGQRLMRKILQIKGMTCTSCEMKIENALKISCLLQMLYPL